MKFDVQTKGEVSIVRIGEDYAGPDGDLANAVNPLIERPGAKVVLDLTAVGYINSAALGELVRITAQANSQEARVVLAGLTPFVAGVLDTTRLSRFFEIHATVEDAVAKLSA
ncbi:MAG: STAS domain-containing protein [Planctomycetes bacterium]|nr:STAS domain-containing protein [Planctomycetota bacterium]